MTRKALKGVFYFLEEIGGTILGCMLRYTGSLGRGLYRALVAWNRRQSDTITIHLAPFFTAFGTAQFDRGASTIESLKLLNGPLMKLDLSEKTQRQVYSHKLFEAGLSRFLLKTLTKGDTFIDVGSNVGYFAFLAAPSVGASGKILALEPEKKNFEILEQTAKENNLPQIRPLKIAAADQDGGTMQLNVNPLNRGGNSMIPFETYSSGAHQESIAAIQEQFKGDELFQEVPVRTLDSLAHEQSITKIRLMKIDVEGFEMSVLEGSHRLFEKGIPENVVCEVNNPKTEGFVLAFFSKYRYLPYIINFNGSLSPLSETKVLHGNILFISERASTNRFCPLCEKRVPAFLPSNARPGQPIVDQYQIVAMGSRPERDCPWCGASDKERLVFSYLEKKTTLFSDAPVSVLHIAPEKNTMRILKSRKNVTYASGDKFDGDTRYADGRYGDSLTLDVTALPFPDNSFDVVLCNHVLEHVPDDAKAMREIVRVLAPGGYAILQVPVTRMQKESVEDATVSTSEGRTLAFGQVDHVRIYAEEDYRARLKRAGFRVEAVAQEDFLSNEEQERMGLNPLEKIYVAYTA